MEPDTTKTSITEPSVSAPVPETAGKSLAQKLKNIGTNLLIRFYSNKKIFWPITIAFGLIVLMLIIGSIFGGKRNQPEQAVVITPTPFIQVTPIPSPSVGLLKDIGDKLTNLKNSIEDWDPKQGKLQPMNLNFDIRF